MGWDNVIMLVWGLNGYFGYSGYVSDWLVVYFLSRDDCFIIL